MALPKYLKINSKSFPCVLRLNYNNLYYKDNGCWELREEERNGKFFAVGGYSTGHFDGIEMVEATYEEYFEETGEKYAVREEDYKYDWTLYNADPDCEHDVQPVSSGVKCTKCTGWYCA
jgi:hypothetical protein